MPRRDGRREAAVALATYGAYLAVRRAVWTDDGRARATRNAQRVLAAERRLRVDVEARAQRVALRLPLLVDVLNTGYAIGNVALSVGWLLRLHRRDDAAFARERTAALLAFAGGLPVFAALPTAPPRTLDGFVDTLAARGMSIDRPVLVRFYNPIAAMPSHHVAFAVVTGIGLAGRSGTRIGRAGWRAYPLAISLVVVATGNHFLADVVAGAVLGALAREVAR